MTAAKIPCRHGLWLIARVIQIGPRNQLSICNAKKPPSYIFCKKTDMNRVTTSFRLFLTKETSPSTFLYSAAITGGPCRSLGNFASVRLSGAIFHIPSFIPLSLWEFLCKMQNICTLSVTVFTYIKYANIFRNICKHSFFYINSCSLLSFFTILTDAKIAIKFGITISPLNISDIFHTKSTFKVEPTKTQTTTKKA